VPDKHGGRINMQELVKPVVMPEQIWIETRLIELARGIHEYAMAGNFSEPVKTWLLEFEERLIERDKL
jgi:hypothetical protein